MSRSFLFLFFSIICVSLFSNELDIEELIEIDVLVTVESENKSDIISVDVTKYTVNNRSVNIKLKGYDGELLAYLTPKILPDNNVELIAMCEVKNLSGKLIKVSDKVLVAGMDEKIMFYPLGGTKIEPRVIMELTLKRFGGI